jgi:hypothetical protein
LLSNHCFDVDYGLAGSPDGMFTAGQFSAAALNRHLFLFIYIEIIETSPPLSQGPISESDFFTWEALICGPKDTPFVSNQKQTRVLSTFSR